MADNRGDPQLSWQTIVAMVVVVGLLAGAQWTIFQNQFANTDKTISEIGRRLAIVEATQQIRASKLAHEPVEASTFNAVTKATDDKILLLQNQITDINRQIAAALIIIDNNAGTIRKAPTVPP
jgi:hypothetical protein